MQQSWECSNVELNGTKRHAKPGYCWNAWIFLGGGVMTISGTQGRSIATPPFCLRPPYHLLREVRS
jgi:hypothetical protein